MKIKICLKMQNEVWSVHYKNIWMKFILIIKMSDDQVT